jgi:hypothetical protein
MIVGVIHPDSMDALHSTAVAANQISLANCVQSKKLDAFMVS